MPIKRLVCWQVRLMSDFDMQLCSKVCEGVCRCLHSGGLIACGRVLGRHAVSFCLSSGFFGLRRLCRKLEHSILALRNAAESLASRLAFSDQPHCLARRDCTTGCSAFQPSLICTCAPCHVLLSNCRTCVLCRWFGNTMDYDQDAPRQVLCDWITNSGGGVAAFDFPTKGILQEAVRYTQYDRLRDRSGGASGLLGWWPQKACTFIDNHDTGERHDVKTHDGVMQASLSHSCFSLSWQTEVLHCALCTRACCTRQLLSALT